MATSAKSTCLSVFEAHRDSRSVEERENEQTASEEQPAEVLAPGEEPANQEQARTSQEPAANTRPDQVDRHVVGRKRSIGASHLTTDDLPLGRRSTAPRLLELVHDGIALTAHLLEFARRLQLFGTLGLEALEFATGGQRPLVEPCKRLRLISAHSIELTTGGGERCLRLLQCCPKFPVVLHRHDDE